MSELSIWEMGKGAHKCNIFATIWFGRDKTQLQRVMKENGEAYSDMDGDTKGLLEVVVSVKFQEEYIDIEQGKERYNMLKAFEDMMIEGKAEGRIEDILDLLKELGQVPQTIVELIRQKMT